MSDDTNTGPGPGAIAAAFGVLVAVAVATAIGVGTKEDPTPTDVVPLATATQLGLVPPAAVYKAARSDGGTTYYALAQVDAGCAIDPKLGTAVCTTAQVQTFLDHSPCLKRPAKTDPSQCMRSTVDPRTGKPVIIDPGDENVMQAGEGVGPGCVEVPCAVFFGEDPP